MINKHETDVCVIGPDPVDRSRKSLAGLTRLQLFKTDRHEGAAVSDVLKLFLGLLRSAEKRVAGYRTLEKNIALQTTWQ